MFFLETGEIKAVERTNASCGVLFLYFPFVFLDFIREIPTVGS